MKRICVFTGSREGRNSVYRMAAGNLGKILAAREVGIVYGGGHIGLMGVLADAALAEGGEV
ncbi:MAG: TIGR00730 family Rossman fold protein, partial [bacterium]